MACFKGGWCVESLCAVANSAPRPWKFDIEGGTWHIRDAAGNSMMSNEQYYPWVPDGEADWNLIAAAPSMYAALKLIVNHTNFAGCIQNGTGGVGTIARDALAQAEGKDQSNA